NGQKNEKIDNKNNYIGTHSYSSPFFAWSSSSSSRLNLKYTIIPMASQIKGHGTTSQKVSAGKWNNQIPPIICLNLLYNQNIKTRINEKLNQKPLSLVVLSKINMGFVGICGNLNAGSLHVVYVCNLLLKNYQPCQ